MANGRYRIKSQSEIREREAFVRESWINVREKVEYEEAGYFGKIKVVLRRINRRVFA